MVAGSIGSSGSNGHGTNNDNDDNNDADDAESQVLLHLRASLYGYTATHNLQVITKETKNAAAR